MLNQIPTFLLIILITALTTFFVFTILPLIFPYFSFTQSQIIGGGFLIFILVSSLYKAINIGRFKQFITHILIWQFIVLVIIILYSFKGELSEVKIRVISAIFPSYGITFKPGEIRVSRSMDGHFYIQTKVNNIPIKFMIDTGASDVALTKQDAKKLNFNLSKLQYTKIYSTANGLSAAAPVLLENFMLGNKLFQNVNAAVTSGDNDISLLGMSIISRFKSFRIDNDILILSY